MGEVTPIINIHNLKPLCGKHRIVRIIDMANLHPIPICEQDNRPMNQQNTLQTTMNATIVTGEYTVKISCFIQSSQRISNSIIIIILMQVVGTINSHNKTMVMVVNMGSNALFFAKFIYRVTNN